MPSIRVKRICALFSFFIFASGALAGGRGEGYLAVIQKFRTLKTRIINVEKNIHEGLAAKGQAKDPEKKEQILRQVTRDHDELKALYKEYEELERELRFRYPEKNDDEPREYKLFRLRSIEQMEQELGLDGQLDSLRDKIRRKYPNSTKPEEAQPEDAKKPPSDAPFRLEN